jgi:hypothetical protein
MHTESRRLSSDENNRNERGVALTIALLFTFIAGGVIVSGTLMLRANERMAEVRFRQDDQAAQFARSGLTEAMSWFRRQTAQPVTEFKPLRDTTANPPILDTDDAGIGLVRQFRISKNVWGRYEVWREDENDPDPTRLEFRRKFQAKDVSNERGFTGNGNVWLVRCIGYVYQQLDPNVNWNERPNRVLAVATYEGEIQRLAIQLPGGEAAVCVKRGDNCTIGSNGRVRGGATAAGILYPKNTNDPLIGPLTENRVKGSPSLSAITTYDDRTRTVFGVSQNELRSMADVVVSNPAEFPDPVPVNALVFVETGATMTFDSIRGLNGTGIVYVAGSLAAISGNNSSFNGLLFVTGDMSIEETADIYGAAVVQGNVTVKGSGDYATIWYDADALSAVRREIGQYRWVGAFRPVINKE